MKIRYKVSLVAACVLFVTTSLLSLVQVGQIRTILRNQVEASISESSNAAARQIENWLNGKLRLMDLASQVIDSQYSPQVTQRVIDSPILKDEFKLVFGALESDGKPIKNTASWNPKPDYDGRTRPWYATGKAGRQAVLTEPYKDSTTGEILISAVARINDGGQPLGCSVVTSALLRLPMPSIRWISVGPVTRSCSVKVATSFLTRTLN